MAGTINKPKKPKSKRSTVRLRNKIEKRSVAKQRKSRKLAKNNPQWKSRVRKVVEIPNSVPFKDQMLDEIEQHRLRKQEEAQRRRELAKAARTRGEEDGVVETVADDSTAMDNGFQNQQGLSEDHDDDSMMDEEEEDVDESNPMAALLASARAAAQKYQKELESGSEMDGDSDDDDSDSGAVSYEVPNGKANSRKAYDKIFKQVVEQADVILYVLDARDPEGTRSRDVERSIMAAASGGKRLILVLNKIDLIPTHVLRGWLSHLRRFFPTLPLRAAASSASTAVTFSHGADLTPQRTSTALFHALKAFAASRNMKRAIAVGVVGYPNVGKSSVVNALLGRMAGKGGKGGKACPAGAEAGVTTSIRAVKIDSKLTLLDSPGIVFPSSSSSSQSGSSGLVLLKNATEAHAHLVLLNAVPPKQIDDPIPAVSLLIRRLSQSSDLMQQLFDTYGLPPLIPSADGDTTTDFLVQVARKRGRLGKGGVPNLNAAAMTVITDWRDGRIQGWAEPPVLAVVEGEEEATTEVTMTGDKKPATISMAEGAGPDQKTIVTEWAKEFNIEGLWGDGEAAVEEEMEE